MTPSGRLSTIPFSHYCGLARWALERAGIPFAEDRFAPVFHMIPARRRGGDRTLPVWECGEARIQGSLNILRWADERVPEARRLWPSGADAGHQEAWLDAFDRRLGPASRRIAYVHLLDERDLIDRYLRSQLPAGRARRWRWAAPLTHAMMRRALRLDAEGAARSTERVEAIFGELGDALAAGRPYLAGDRFGAADLAFASLASPLVVPPEDATLPPLEACPSDFVERVKRWRAAPAGAHALRLWSAHRVEAFS